MPNFVLYQDSSFCTEGYSGYAKDKYSNQEDLKVKINTILQKNYRYGEELNLLIQANFEQNALCNIIHNAIDEMDTRDNLFERIKSFEIQFSVFSSEFVAQHIEPDDIIDPDALNIGSILPYKAHRKTVQHSSKTINLNTEKAHIKTPSKRSGIEGKVILGLLLEAFGACSYFFILDVFDLQAPVYVTIAVLLVYTVLVICFLKLTSSNPKSEISSEFVESAINKLPKIVKDSVQFNANKRQLSLNKETDEKETMLNKQN